MPRTKAPDAPILTRACLSLDERTVTLLEKIGTNSRCPRQTP